MSSSTKEKEWHQNPLYNLLYRLILIVVAIILIYVICPWIWGGVTSECIVIVIVIIVVLSGYVPGRTEGSD